MSRAIFRKELALDSAPAFLATHLRDEVDSRVGGRDTACTSPVFVTLRLLKVQGLHRVVLQKGKASLPG